MKPSNAWSRWTPILIYLTAAGYITTIALNALAGSGKGNVFNQSTGNVSNKYSTFITPAGWTFSIWGVIYCWLGAGICYCISTIFRRNENGPIFGSPPSLNWTFYLTYVTNFALNIGWLFTWDAENHVGSAILIVLIAYSAWLAIAFATYGSTSHEGALTLKEYWMQKVLVQNGISVYATWTSVASLLNINIAVQYVGQYAADDASIGALCVLIILLVGWFVLENTVLDRYMRFIVMQYPVVIYAVAGILSNQSKTDNLPTNVSALTWTVEALAVVLLLLRVSIVVYKQVKKSPARSSKVGMDNY